jgi:Putative metallopeptidase
MTSILRAAALGFCSIYLAIQPVSAQPSPPRPSSESVELVRKASQIDIAYVEPRNPKYRPIHQRLKQLHVLETLQAFLAPLRLPEKLMVKVDECGGALTTPYRPQGPVTICYEYVALIEANRPTHGYVYFGRGIPTLTENKAIIGPFVELVLQQVAYAVFDILQIPIWGRMDEAADNVGAFISLEFGKDVALTTILGNAWFLAQRGVIGAGYFSDPVRPTEAQRFYNFLCIAYGGWPDLFRFLIDDFNLPKGRADGCRSEYRQLRRSFRQTIMPHVDRELLKVVQAKKDWLPK